MLDSAFKTREVPDRYRPHSKNKLYVKTKTRKQCPVCKTTQSRSHCFKTLWSLYMHVIIQHPKESTDFIVIQARKLANEGERE